MDESENEDPLVTGSSGMGASGMALHTPTRPKTSTSPTKVPDSKSKVKMGELNANTCYPCFRSALRGQASMGFCHAQKGERANRCYHCAIGSRGGCTEIPAWLAKSAHEFLLAKRDPATKPSVGSKFACSCSIG